MKKNVGGKSHATFPLKQVKWLSSTRFQKKKRLPSVTVNKVTPTSNLSYEGYSFRIHITTIKGSVSRELTRVPTGINRKVFFSGWVGRGNFNFLFRCHLAIDIKLVDAI
jgi:hypothetical protein